MLCLTFFTKAQKVHFADTTDIWQVNVPFSGGGNCYNCRYEYSYTGMDSSGVYCILKGNNVADSAWIREDTISHKVYAKIIRSSWITPDTDEVLLYDFSLQVGDTFKMAAGINGAATFEHIVSSIDTIMVGNIAHKLFHFSGLSNPTRPYDVIEGIGCLQGPLHPYFPFLFEERRELYCFSTGGTNPYLNPAPSSVTTFDFTPVGIEERSTPFHNINTCSLLDIEGVKNLAALSIFPQPASNNVTVKLPPALETGTAILTDIAGQIIFKRKFSEQKQIIIAHPARAGIYYLSIQGRNSITTEKLVFY
jgi:hypothetical protein